MRPLWFTVDDRTLSAITETLNRFCPAELHARAWDIVLGETERRKNGAAPAELKMPSGVFDTLPTRAQDLLRPHAAPAPRRAA